LVPRIERPFDLRGGNTKLKLEHDLLPITTIVKLYVSIFSKMEGWLALIPYETSDLGGCQVLLGTKHYWAMVWEKLFGNLKSMIESCENEREVEVEEMETVEFSGVASRMKVGGWRVVSTAPTWLWMVGGE